MDSRGITMDKINTKGRLIGSVVDPDQKSDPDPVGSETNHFGSTTLILGGRGALLRSPPVSH